MRYRESRAQRTDQIKGRNFEVPGCRTFLLTNRIPGLSEYYVPGHEVGTFDGKDDLLAQVRRYLHDDDAREAIADAGYERTLRDHTYEKRFRQIFETIGID